LMEETGVPAENHRPVTSHWYIIESGVKHHNPIHRGITWSVYAWGNNTQPTNWIFI
jgi:hypothetical protein